MPIASTGRLAYPPAPGSSYQMAGMVPTPATHAKQTLIQHGGGYFQCCNGSPSLPPGDPHARCDWIDFCRGGLHPCAMGTLNAYGNYQPGYDGGACRVQQWFESTCYGILGWVPHMVIRHKVAARLNGGVAPASMFDLETLAMGCCCPACLACQGLKAMRANTTAQAHDGRINTLTGLPAVAGTSSRTGHLIAARGGGLFDCFMGVPDLKGDPTDVHGQWDLIDFCKSCLCYCEVMAEANAFGDYQPIQDDCACCALCCYECFGLGCCAMTDIRRKVEARINGGKEAAQPFPMTDVLGNCFCAPCAAFQTIKAVRAETTRSKVMALATAQPPIMTDTAQNAPATQAEAVGQAVGSTVGGAIGKAVAGKKGAAVGAAIGAAVGSVAGNKVAPSK